jgi:uncharacterized glyoxalase superfamily protein PhnB
MDSLSPNIFVKDMTATIAFYQQLGFQVIMSVPAQGETPSTEGEASSTQTKTPPTKDTPDKSPLVWAMMTNGNVTMMFQTFDSLGDTLPAISRQDGGSLLFYIKLPGIRTFFDTIKAKVNVVQGLQKTFYGATEFSITDNNNYMLTFAEDEGD